MNRFSALACAIVMSAAGLPPVAAAPEAEAAAGRALVKRYADTIVGIELVVTVKMKMGDREASPREQRMEANGTVISPSGLTVTSLFSVDPQAQFEAARFQGGRGPELVGTDFKEVKLRLADGKELPARFVLKDADLDLAFMAPEGSDAGREFPYVNLEQSAEGTVLGTYYFVNRATKALQRTPLVRSSEITGIIEKPRRYFLMTDVYPGVPMLDTQGRVLGITFHYLANGRTAGYVVLPAPDIADIAKQAAAAQATAK